MEEISKEATEEVSAALLEVRFMKKDLNHVSHHCVCLMLHPDTHIYTHIYTLKHIHTHKFL